jgi:hypothetical protein
MIFDVGDVVEIEASVTNAKSGSAVDPTSPLFRVQTPAGDTEDLTPTKSATGKYSCSYLSAEPGTHRILYLGTGTNAVAGETQFRVREPRVPRG